MKGMVTVAAGKTVAVRQEAAMKTGETPVAGTTGPSAAPVVVKAQAAAPSGDMTDGEVRKVDKDNKKITLKHGESRASTCRR